MTPVAPEKMALGPLWPHEYRLESCVLLCCWRALWVGGNGTWQPPAWRRWETGPRTRCQQDLGCTVGKLLNNEHCAETQGTLQWSSYCRYYTARKTSLQSEKRLTCISFDQFTLRWCKLNLLPSSCSALTLISSPHQHDKMLHTTQQENSPPEHKPEDYQTGRGFLNRKWPSMTLKP